MASWKSILTESHEVSSSSEEIVQLSNDLKSLDVDGSAYSIVNDNLILGSHCDQLTSNNDAHFEPFCTMYNLEHCIAYLNQEMISLGIASLYDSGSGKFNITRLVNAIYNLLQRFHQGVRIRENLEDSKHRAASDLEHHQQEKRRLRSALEQLQRELAQEQLKQCDLLKLNNLLNNKLKSEKEEVKRLMTLIQNRDVQYKHSVRKMESELMKLKERLHLLLVEKTDRKINIDMSEALVRSDGKRGKWKTGCSNVEDLYRSVVSGCEEKQKMVLVENEELRLCLRELHKGLASLLYHSTLQNDSEEELDEDVTVSASDLDESLPDGCFEMPYEMVAETIMSKLRRQIELLRPLIKKSDISGNAKYLKGKSEDEQQRNEIEKLRKKVDRYRSLIEHTQKLYKHNMSTEHLLRTMSVVSADIVEERERLTLEKKHFYEQVAVFNGDNRLLEEAAVELNSEELLENELQQILPYVRCQGHEGREEESQLTQSKRFLPVAPTPCISTSTYLNNSSASAEKCCNQPASSDKNSSDKNERKSLERSRPPPAGIASTSISIDSQHMTAPEKRIRPATAVITNRSSRHSSGVQGEVAGHLSKTQKSSTSLVPSSSHGSNVDHRTEAKTILIGQTRHQKQK